MNPKTPLSDEDRMLLGMLAGGLENDLKRQRRMSWQYGLATLLIAGVAVLWDWAWLALVVWGIFAMWLWLRNRASTKFATQMAQVLHKLG